jgi:hypothetical protein
MWFLVIHEGDSRAAQNSIHKFNVEILMEVYYGGLRKLCLLEQLKYLICIKLRSFSRKIERFFSRLTRLARFQLIYLKY